jgi:hypothetical protein
MAGLSQRLAATVAMATIVLALGATAHAQEPNPEEFTPPGYTFCGWLNLQTRQWQMEWSDDLAGAFHAAFARNMTCRDARRASVRVRFPQHPPFSRPPTRPGWRCRYLKRGIEYADVRCTSTSGPSRAFRFRSGA